VETLRNCFARSSWLIKPYETGIRYFPALMLADPKSGAVKPVSYGFISQDDLAKQFLNVSTDFAPNF